MISFFKKKEKKALAKRNMSREVGPLRRQLFIGVSIFTLLALCIGLVWYVTRIESFQIKHIEVIGGTTVPHSVISDSVEQTLTGTYFHLIPKRFILLYPKYAIIESLHRQDRIKNIQVDLIDKQTLSVVFDEYVPNALWCKATISENCFFIDKTGYAFAQAPALEGSSFVRYVEEGVTPVVKTNSFDSKYIHNTELFTELLKEKLSIYITQIKKLSTYDIEYTVAGGGIIKVAQTMAQAQRKVFAIFPRSSFAQLYHTIVLI